MSSNPIHGEVRPDTTICDKVCQWLATGQWFSPGTPASSTNKTDRHDINEILLKVALNTIKSNQTKPNIGYTEQGYDFNSACPKIAIKSLGLAETLFVCLIQYSQRQSGINHCDRVSLFLVILIYFLVCLIYLFTFLCILGDSK